MHNSLVTKGIVIGMLVLFVGASVIPGMSDKGKDRDIIYVNWDGSGDYTTIQDGINAANPDDTVFVFNGTYFEHIIVNKQINLVGEDRETTIIDGGAVDNHDVVLVSADGVSISEFMIRNSGNISGGQYDSGVEIRSHDNNIFGNIICYNNDGIYIRESNNNTISDNNINSNNEYGIRTFISSDTIISDNSISNNNYGGIRLQYSSNDVINLNTIENNTYEGIILVGSSNNTITNNYITNNTIAGLGIWYSLSNVISNNTLINGHVLGIGLGASSNNNLVSYNLVMNNSHGITLWDSSDFNSITSNSIHDNENEGISLDGSSNNSITFNNITNNNFYGIHPWANSNNNIIHHNNLIDNNPNAYDECYNIWDSGYWSGGNYWSDYTGEDFYHGPGQNETGRDWRGDTPYNIAGGSNQDMYPLILPYEPECPFAIIEHPSDGLITSEHNVTIIGYITDNVGLVKSGTMYKSEWEGIATWTETLHDELIPHLDFEFVKELKPGWNEIGIHATDPSNNHGEDSVLVYYYPEIVYADDDYNSSTQGWQQYCFNSIQDGVDAVAESGTVFVFNGTYYENVVVHKSINLVGESKDSTIIDGGKKGDVVIATYDGVNISGFKIQNSSDIEDVYAGINLLSNYNTIVNNNIGLNNWCGIFFENSNTNNIYDNTIMNNVYGMNLFNSNNNAISNNNVSDSVIGIRLYHSNNTIFNNVINSNDDGILIEYSSNNAISDNIVSDNMFGIILYSSSSNIISTNIISSNDDYGIYVGSSSGNNYIYHNNFLNNNMNAYDEYDNIWNDTYPSGGNFWDDYWGVDEDDDGIGDTPYDIPGGDNQDLYPLMYPWGEMPPVANFTYWINNLTVTFDASSSYDRDGEIVTWLWDFGDGVEGAGEIVEHSYSEGGTYDATLTVIDNDGYEGQITKQIEVENGGYEFETILIIGRITNLNAEGDIITFEAGNIRCITFFPFSFNHYTSGEQVIISEDYFGLVGTRFIFALCSASVGDYSIIR